MLNFTTSPPIAQSLPINIPDSRSGGKRAPETEPAEAGQSVDKARSADSIELFVSEGQSYDANKDSGHMWWYM